MRRLPELLAPAGSLVALQAAVAAGADAVYLSGKRFGARKFAENFDEPALAGAIDYAHLRGVRVYVTVNTLIRESELYDAASYLLRLYEMGADAVLIQDTGLSHLAALALPGLERHASTQMTIHNLPGLLWAERAGFKRAVLAREVSLEEIERMNRERDREDKRLRRERRGEGGQDSRDDILPRPRIGMEVFVHGALCYSYSGQCLLSSAIGGRSGNRGMCAQPCRKPYVLLRGGMDEFGRPAGLAAEPLREQFLLSARDLCTYRRLPEIVRSPVSALKIEGRMKSPEYVATVVSIYRRALDGIAAGRWTPSAEDERNLAIAFNRDFTEGHLLGAKEVMGREMSDNRGLLIGSVASFDSQRGEAAVRLSAAGLAPEKGDGLVFLAPGQEVGLVVQSVQERGGLLRLKTPERIRPGARVYLTGSLALAKKAQQIIASERGAIAIDVTLTWLDGRLVASARLPDGRRVEAAAGFVMEKARSRPTSRQQIEAQMRRTGGTPFAVQRVEMDYAEDLFAPLGALNQLRRDLLEKVEAALLKERRPACEDVERARQAVEAAFFGCLSRAGCSEDGAPRNDPSLPQVSSPPSTTTGPARLAGGLSLAVYADSLEAVRGAVSAGCRRIYFEPALWQKDGKGWPGCGAKAAGLMAAAAEICGPAELFWKWPRIARDEFFPAAIALLETVKVDGVMIENVGGIEALREAGLARPPLSHLRLLGGPGLNIGNHQAVEALPSLEALTLSPELSARQIEGLALARRGGTALELVVQGSLEVMVAEDCIPCLAKGGYDPSLFWGLQDMRRIFPLRLDEENRTRVFNSAETCLLDMMPQIRSAGLDGIAVDARGRTEAYARRMVDAYGKAIRLTAQGGADLAAELERLKEEIRPLALGGITYGHFVKGLKDELS